MRIAFDLDGTLLPISPGQFEAFQVSRPIRWFIRERVRTGASGLLRELQAEGHEVWIYTTSLRSPRYVWWLFFAFGVRLSGIVNADVHAHALHGHRVNSSKYPPEFGIDLLVDDSIGVELEGKSHGFRVVRVDPDDRDWVGKVRSAVA